ncbi:MAG: Mu transposase C-terminal domain-containing protein, partial [Phycisphaerae bacterium]
RLPTIDELRKVLARFIDFYNSRAHRGAGMFGLAPIEAMARFRDGPVRMESETVLEFLFLDFVGPKLVRRDGIRCLHRWYGHGDPRLIALQGTKVYLGLDPCDVRTAYVCDLLQRPLFQAAADGHVVRSKRDAERLAQQRGRIRRGYAELARRGRALLLATEPAQLIDYQRTASEVQHRPSTQSSTPRVITARPMLEKALDHAGPAPVEAGSNDVRAQNEGAFDLADLVDHEEAPARLSDEDRINHDNGLDVEELLEE